MLLSILSTIVDRHDSCNGEQTSLCRILKQCAGERGSETKLRKSKTQRCSYTIFDEHPAVLLFFLGDMWSQLQAIPSEMIHNIASHKCVDVLISRRHKICSCQLRPVHCSLLICGFSRSHCCVQVRMICRGAGMP